MRLKLNITCLLLVLITSSCNKWLELEPQDGITRQEFWRTKEDVKAALNGIYSSMIDGGVEQSIFLWGELRADMIEVTTYASEDLKFVRNSNILTTNSVANWSAIYKTINNCNLLIEFAAQAKALDPTFTETLYNSYVGEALTIRSLMYFYLVKTFRDVPLKLKGSYKDSEIREIGKSTDKEVLTQIIADLVKAEAMVPDLHHVNPDNQINKGRITKSAVNTLLADVYLWNEEYQKAVDATDKVLLTERYALINTSGAWFERVFLTGSSPETIFELNHKESVSNPFYGLFLDNRRSFTISPWVTTDIFPQNMEIDVDLNDGRGQGVFFNAGAVIRKQGLENPNFTNFQVYRYSDVLL
ncbi:RagB/SusD family nutrient uptake outer membrane protein, partial [Pseudoxanthomonas sp. SGD-10]